MRLKYKALQSLKFALQIIVSTFSSDWADLSVSQLLVSDPVADFFLSVSRPLQRTVQQSDVEVSAQFRALGGVSKRPSQASD